METLTLSTIKNSLLEMYDYLESNYQVATLGVFGSYARQTQHPESDADILVTFTEPPSLLRFIELEQYLSDQLDIKVDLVMKNSLRSHVSRQILREVVPV